MRELGAEATAGKDHDDKDNVGIKMKTPRSAFYGPSKDKAKPNVIYLSDDAGSFIGKVNDGGLTIIGDELTPFSGYNPTTKANVYDFDPQVKKWFIPQSTFKRGQEKIRAPVHSMMVRPLSAKGKHIATINCSTWPHPEKWFGTDITTKNYDSALGSYLHRQWLLLAVIERGLVRQVEYPHPTTGELYNILIHPFEMSIEEITDTFVLKFGKGDSNDRFNAHVSAAL